MYLSACIEWLFREEYPDFSDRVRAAKAQGFSHVEFHLWRDKPLAALAQALAEAAGVTLLLEPLNTRIDHPGMFLNNTRLALDIIEAVDSPRLQLLFDVYHSMVMEEEMEEVLGGRMHRVGHVQIAQAPDRNEPDPRSGEWPNVIARLQRLGYNGAIGLEYKPSLPAAASVARAREATGLSC